MRMLYKSEVLKTLYIRGRWNELVQHCRISLTRNAVRLRLSWNLHIKQKHSSDITIKVLGNLLKWKNTNNLWKSSGTNKLTVTTGYKIVSILVMYLERDWPSRGVSAAHVLYLVNWIFNLVFCLNKHAPIINKYTDSYTDCAGNVITRLFFLFSFYHYVQVRG